MAGQHGAQHQDEHQDELQDEHLDTAGRHLCQQFSRAETGTETEARVYFDVLVNRQMSPRRCQMQQNDGQKDIWTGEQDADADAKSKT
ncbi:hypothetical protein ACLKA6_011304 [Drosophila palustris]